MVGYDRGVQGGSSSEISAMVKSETVVMLIDGDCGTCDPGFVCVSGVTTGSSEGGRGI